MGFTKKMELERHEREYAEHLRELKEEADAVDPEGHWDPEDWEAFNWALEKDD